MFRGFISIDIGALPQLVEVKKELERTGADLKLVEPANIHLTLKFLGDTREELVDRITELMNKSVTDLKPFRIRLKGVGAFPNLNYPRVVWVGLENAENLAIISERLENSLVTLGFKKEKRKFSPHVTIGRVRSRRNKEKLQEFIRANSEKEFGDLEINCIRLKKSVLTQKGPEYFTVKEIAFPS